jgi:hypothetical protein
LTFFLTKLVGLGRVPVPTKVAVAAKGAAQVVAEEVVAATRARLVGVANWPEGAEVVVTPAAGEDDDVEDDEEVVGVAVAVGASCQTGVVVGMKVSRSGG